jgi:hypothetical protein
MTQEIAGSMMLALMVLALAGAGWGWYRHIKRSSPLKAHLTFDVPDGEPTLSVRALYVATTKADDPIARVAAGPLAYRAKASLSLFPEGVVVKLAGSDALLIPGESGLQAGLATWTIDRVVEPEGLLMLRWTLGDTPVDSYFRIVDGDVHQVVKKISDLQEKTV